MRILFAVFQTGTRANGGLESVSGLIRGSVKWGQALVVTNAESAYTQRWRADGATVQVWSLPYRPGTSFKSNGFAGILRRLASMVRTNWNILRLRRHFDILHCNDPAPFWHAVPAARLAGKKVILNLRDTKSGEEGLDLARYARRFRRCDLVLVLSEEMKSFYRQVPGNFACEWLYSSVDFTRMLPVDADARAALRAKLGLAPDRFAVAFVAVFNDKKNQRDYLRHAVPELARQLPAALTCFVGDFVPEENPYAHECAGLAAAEGMMSAVRFVGYTATVEEWYQACDLVVVPTRKEGLARCMIESLACGTPVVSFDVSSAREILEGHACGLVAQQGDYPALVAAIVRLAGNPGLRATMSGRGAAMARELFVFEKTLEKYQALCVRLLSS